MVIIRYFIFHLTETPDQNQKTEEESSVRAESSKKPIEYTKTQESNVKENIHEDYNVKPQEENITKNEEIEKQRGNPKMIQKKTQKKIPV